MRVMRMMRAVFEVMLLAPTALITLYEILFNCHNIASLPSTSMLWMPSKAKAKAKEIQFNCHNIASPPSTSM